jgi:PPOX class probable F420-dependent enzyme
VDVEEARQYLRDNHRAVLATIRRDGRPQLSPVSVGVDDEGYAVISTRETAVKTKNLQREPWASLCVFSDKFFGAWVQVEGTAHIVHLPEAMDLLVSYYRSLAGEHADWDEYRAAMERERRVMIRIAIERAGPNVSG